MGRREGDAGEERGEGDTGKERGEGEAGEERGEGDAGKERGEGEAGEERGEKGEGRGTRIPLKSAPLKVCSIVPFIDRGDDGPPWPIVRARARRRRTHVATGRPSRHRSARGRRTGSGKRQPENR